MVKDLVCGMMVDEKSPAARTIYKGKEYFFYSESCRQNFEKDPEKYIFQEQQRSSEKQS